MKTVQCPDNIERTENGERFANASIAGTTNTTINQTGRLASIFPQMNRPFPRALLWSQLFLSNSAISASV